MADLAISNSTPKTAVVRMANQLAQKYERAKSLANRAKEDGKRMTKVGIHATLAASGGAAHGVLEAKMPTIGDTEVRTGLAIGAALVVVGLLDLGGDLSDQASTVGSGMLAAEASRAAEKWARG